MPVVPRRPASVPLAIAATSPLRRSCRWTGGSAVAVPALQRRRRVEELPTLVPAGWRPHLEMEVAAGCVSGLADVADPLSGVDRLALLEEGGRSQMHVDEVLAGRLAVDHEVVPRRALVSGVLDAPAASGDQRRAAGGSHILALVRMTRAGRADSVPVLVRPSDREDVAVELEAHRQTARPGLAGTGAARRADPEG